MTPFETTALFLSLKVALAAVAGALPVSIMLAWLLAKSRLRGKTVLDILIHIPMVVPPVVVGYALLALFGPRAQVGAWFSEMLGIEIAFTWKAAAIAAAIMALPLMVRTIRLSMEAVDPRVEAVARTLGASEVRIFRTVTLPLCLPGIVAATILGFARAIGEFGATIAFAASIPGVTETLPLAIYNAMQTPGGETAALRLCLISLGLAVVALAGAEAFIRLSQRRPS